MKKIFIERNIVVFLFVIVLVIFSLAERDSKKLENIYVAGQLLEKAVPGLHETAANISPVPEKTN